MALSEELVSLFAKTVNAQNSKKDPNTAKTAYGKIIEYDGQKYAQLDGSDQLTPVEITTSVKNGDRVTVKIENHTAIVTGNLSDPSASGNTVTEMGSHISEFEIIIAHKVTAEELAATNAYIENLRAISAKFEEMSAVTAKINELQAKLATIDHLTAIDIEALNAEFENLRATFGEFDVISTEDLTAVNAEIDNLKAYVGEFTYVSADVLNAIQASIKKLDTDKLDAKTADIKYANIDFANITELAVKKIFADYGVIEEIIISEGTVVKELVGVRIKGDLIEANTLKADSLVVKGSDGIYYRLNVECGAVVEPAKLTQEEIDQFQNGLSGTVIIAKSITAEKVAVDDLVAFGADIAGFHMSRETDESGNRGIGKLYSDVKSDVHNSTPGVYLDNEGQAAFGDSDQYFKYYKDDAGNYNLEIAASSVLFGSERKSVDEAIADSSDALNQTIDDKTSQLVDKIDTVDSDAQNKFAMLEGYVHIDPDNATITLGKSNNSLKLVMKNDKIIFEKNGTEIGYWDGVDFHTGNIVVEVNNRAQFGNFAFLPRTDGSMMLLKVGDS